VHDRDKLGNETEMEHKNKSIIRMKKMTSLQWQWTALKCKTLGTMVVHNSA